MTYKRLLLVIALVTCLGFITVWQQIQTTRWGYRISKVIGLKKQLMEEQDHLEIQLTYLTSPRQLLTSAQQKEIAVDYQEGTSVVNAYQNRLSLPQRIINRLAYNRE